MYVVAGNKTVSGRRGGLAVEAPVGRADRAAPERRAVGEEGHAVDAAAGAAGAVPGAAGRYASRDPPKGEPSWPGTLPRPPSWPGTDPRPGTDPSWPGAAAGGGRGGLREFRAWRCAARLWLRFMAGCSWGGRGGLRDPRAWGAPRRPSLPGGSDVGSALWDARGGDRFRSSRALYANQKLS